MQSEVEHPTQLLFQSPAKFHSRDADENAYLGMPQEVKHRIQPKPATVVGPQGFSHDPTAFC